VVHIKIMELMMTKRTNLAVAIFLILIGSWFLAIQLYPALKAFAYGAGTWPLSIFGAGALLGILGLLFWVPGMMVPAAVVAGIGGLLYWQNLTGNWASWAYAWALIPGFSGVGTLLSGLLQRRWSVVRAGGWMLLYSLVLFAVFGSFLGGWGLIGQYWPLLLILLGLITLSQNFLHRRAA
jgi:hypothetical protein